MFTVICAINPPDTFQLNEIFPGEKLNLLPRRIPEHQHRRREYTGRQQKKLSVDFAVFHDVPDVAGPDAKALDHCDSIFHRNVGIRCHRQEIADTRLTRLAAIFRETSYYF